MEKIRKLSRFFHVLFIVIFFLLPAIFLLYWSTAGFEGYPNANWMSKIGIGYSSLPIDLNIPPLTDLSLKTKIFGFLIDLPSLSIDMAMVYFLIRLFKKYEKLEIFTSSAVKDIRSIGICAFIGCAIRPIHGMLMTLALSFDNAPGERFINISFSFDDLFALITGFLIVLISWIMKEAARLQEEQTYTV